MRSKNTAAAALLVVKLMIIKYVLNPAVNCETFRRRQKEKERKSSCFSCCFPLHIFIIISLRCHVWQMQTRSSECDFLTDRREKRGKHSYDFKLAGSVYFCLYSSVSASPSSCVILTMPPCPSPLCSAHWAVAATLPGFKTQTEEK